MPKIFVLRHQLAEQQARLTGDVKNRLSPLQDEVKYTHISWIETRISTIYGARLPISLLLLNSYMALIPACVFFLVPSPGTPRYTRYSEHSNADFCN